MLQFLVVIVKQALRGFPHIAHKPFLIQNDKPSSLGGIVKTLVPWPGLLNAWL
jgi:hypothetical protein